MQPQTNPQPLYQQAQATEHLERMYYSTQNKPTYYCMSLYLIGKGKGKAAIKDLKHYNDSLHLGGTRSVGDI